MTEGNATAATEHTNTTLLHEYMEIAHIPGKASAKAVTHLCALRDKL